jgi:hypothetical protein
MTEIARLFDRHHSAVNGIIARFVNYFGSEHISRDTA